MEFTGEITKIGETQQVSDRFRKREIIVKYATNPEYPEYIKLEFVQDRVDLLDAFQLGQEVQIWFDLRGRMYTSKKTGEEGNFTSLQGWKIQATNMHQRPAQPVQPEAFPPAPPADNIPF